MRFFEYKEFLLQKIESYFSLFANNIFECKEYDIAAFFSSRQEQTVLFKENVIDFAESKEILLVSDFSDKSDSEFKKDLEKELNLLPLLLLKVANPSRHHKSTVLTRVFVTDKPCDKEVIKLVKKFYFHKAFKFLFWGWVEVGTLLVSLSDKKVYANAAVSRQKKVFI